MDLKIIQYKTPAYDQLVQLRLDILRTPLGLSFTKEQLEKEKDDIHIAAYDNGTLVGCCVLTHYNDSSIQLRQMAVSQDIQSKGFGKKILEYAEQVALEKGYSVLMMHARSVALGFYQKCGYSVKGDEFVEVTIPHYHMEKVLRG